MIKRALTAIVLAFVASLPAASAAQAEITIGPATVTSTGESGSIAFTVTRGAVLLGTAATVRVATASGSATAGADFTPVSQTVTLAAGLLSPTTTTVSVPIVADSLDEDDETFTVGLSDVSAGETIGSPSTAIGVIRDDDPAPRVSVGAASVTEGTGSTATTLAVPVTLSAVSGRAVSVAFATADATATAGSDYTAARGTLTIPPGQAGGTIAVAVSPDALDEDDETLTVTLSGPVNAVLGTSSSTATILDDDTAAITVTGATVLEGAAGAMTATSALVSLSAGSVRPVTVSYSTADGSAVAPGDYVAATGQVTISPGQRTATIPLTVVGDATPEADEALSVNLSASSGAPIAAGGGSATVIIRNDDGPGATVPPSRQGTIITGPGSGLPPLDSTARRGVRLAKVRFDRVAGRMRYAVSCASGLGRCKGSVTVFSVPVRRSQVKGLRREQQLASGRFDVTAGATVTVTLRLSAKGRGWLRSARRVKVTAYAVSRDSQGASSTAKTSGTLRR